MAGERVITAIRARDLPQLREVIQKDLKEARHPRPMQEAARMGWKEGVKLLLTAGADPNAGWRNYRPVHALIQEDPHAPGSTPTKSRVQCLEFLLANGADPELLGGWPSARAIIVAAFMGETIYVETLLKNGAAYDSFAAVALGDLPVAQKAIRSGRGFANVRDGGLLTPLQCCAGSRMGVKDPALHERLLQIATQLLDNQADPNVKTKVWDHNVDAAYFAAASSNRDMFALLLERGADPTAALPAVVWRNNTEFAEIALAHGAEIKKALDGDKPLLNQMIRWGQVRQALWLLEKGADPNIGDSRGWTATHQAASRGNEKIMQAVLDAGGDIAIKDAEGRTPADIAQQTRKPKLGDAMQA